MNTKFKKTALEDDAEIYQHGTKSATKDDIKKLPPKKRIAYFCDYYLAKCLVVTYLPMNFLNASTLSFNINSSGNRVSCNNS